MRTDYRRGSLTVHLLEGRGVMLRERIAAWYTLRLIAQTSSYVNGIRPWLAML